MSIVRTLRVAAAAAVLLVCGFARAAQVVVFVDGRTLEASQVVVRDGSAHLALAGGGRVGVPASRVANLGALSVSESFEEPSPPPAPAPFDDPWRAAAGNYADLIHGAAVRHGVDPALLTSMAIVESAFDPSAVSPKGAQGLMQLIPETAARFGVADAFDPIQNVDGGARYLRWLLQRFDGSTELALAGYNAGEGAVDRHGGIPPYPETRGYVKRIMEGTRRLSAASEPGLAPVR